MKRLRSLLLHNLGWKLLSLLIALALWAVVATEPELATFVTVPLEYRNLPDQLEISSEPATALSLELRGPAGELRNLGERGFQPAVVLEMGGMQPGQHTFTIASANVRLASGVRLVRAIPNQVRYTFDRRMESEVPIRVRFAGEGARGFVIARHSVEPSTVHIVGPAGRVRRITSAVTDLVDLTNAAGSSEFRVNAYVDDSYVRIVSSPQVTVSVTMKKQGE
jgi:hypothetical protein